MTSIPTLCVPEASKSSLADISNLLAVWLDVQLPFGSEAYTFRTLEMKTGHTNHLTWFNGIAASLLLIVLTCVMVCPEICIVHKHSALDWVVETLQQRHDGALATAGLPHKGNLLALRNKGVKAAEEVKETEDAAVLLRFPLLLQLLHLLKPTCFTLFLLHFIFGQFHESSSPSGSSMTHPEELWLLVEQGRQSAHFAAAMYRPGQFSIDHLLVLGFERQAVQEILLNGCSCRLGRKLWF